MEIMGNLPRGRGSSTKLVGRRGYAARMSDFQESRTPNRPRVSLEKLRFLVVVPGVPPEVRSFTIDEEAEAQAYAGRRGVTVTRLPA